MGSEYSIRSSKRCPTRSENLAHVLMYLETNEVVLLVSISKRPSISLRKEQGDKPVICSLEFDHCRKAFRLKIQQPGYDLQVVDEASQEEMG
ncbi:hypothetical protein WAI453_008960 [Rhynchosporium graminicola]